MTGKVKEKVEGFFDKLQRLVLVQAVSRALVALIPILMIGSFATLLESFPIEGYLTFINTWCGGFLGRLFHLVWKATFGMLSVYMAGLIGYQIETLKTDSGHERKYGAMLVSLGSLFLMSGAMDGKLEALGAQGMFVAVVSAGASSELYLFIVRRLNRNKSPVRGADGELENSIHAIFPAALTFVLIVFCNNILLTVFETDSIYELLQIPINRLADAIGSGLAGGLAYVIVSNLLWFLGIHGGDVLEDVSNVMFQSAALQPGQIITRQFLNYFVMIGGCGATICLLIALLLFSRRKETRSIAKISAVPMIFNINEMMVFGLPIVFNPVFLIPFLLVPVVCFLNAYFAVWMGWVPVAKENIQWTTPVIVNACLSTGSVRGVFLQLVNIGIGVIGYAPFVRIYEKKKMESFQEEYNRMLLALKDSEVQGKPIRLTDNSKTYGWMGKALSADLKYAFEHGELMLYYQPQYDDSDKCFGVEALLRWKHPTLGWIYPPLMIKLSEEMGMQENLEHWVVNRVLADAETLRKDYPDAGIEVSVNITGAAIQEKSFEGFLEKLAEENDISGLHICLEITEQDALLLDDELRERFLRLRRAGYRLAVDDFSMGSTSIRYLTGNDFDLVKLDGSLVQGILDNSRCREIIASIVSLSDTLGVKVLAEYVSDVRIREKLQEAGCRLYQGWYYSPAVPLEEFEKLMKQNTQEGKLSE